MLYYRGGGVFVPRDIPMVNAVLNRTSRNIRYEDKTKSYEIHYNQMVELHRQSIKLSFQDTIRSKLIQKFNSDVMRSIIEFL